MTYKDLTDEQLTELHYAAQPEDRPFPVIVDRLAQNNQPYDYAFIVTYCPSQSSFTTFYLKDGDLYAGEDSIHVQSFVRAAAAMGLTY